jgi:hypothetical protein
VKTRHEINSKNATLNATMAIQTNVTGLSNATATALVRLMTSTATSGGSVTSGDDAPIHQLTAIKTELALKVIYLVPARAK